MLIYEYARCVGILEDEDRILEDAWETCAHKHRSLQAAERCPDRHEFRGIRSDFIP